MLADYCWMLNRNTREGNRKQRKGTIRKKDKPKIVYIISILIGCKTI